MSIPYRKELEKAARQMILVHRTDTLIKLIVRTMVRTLRVTHAGIFLFDKDRQCYVLTVSRGKRGIKIPCGLVKISKDSALVRYFSDNIYNLWKDNYLIIEKVRSALKRKHVKKNIEYKKFFEKLLYQLSMYKAKVAFPIIFRNELLGIFILGEKLTKKPFPPDELTFLSILSSDVAMAIRNAYLFESLTIQLEKNQNLFLQTIMALAEAIEAKDKYTIGHTERVVRYALAIAEYVKKNRRIKNWEEFKKNLRVASLLHDIGKIGIPERVLNKKKILSQRERRRIETHTLIGEEILSPIKDLKDVILAVKYHHERYDGKGYPCNLKGRKIPLAATIIAVADAYDAMTQDRPYRDAFPKKVAVKIIKENSGLQFHPKVVEAFLTAYSEGKI
jgi:putative nucleotidyltransferase with HDIG domain